MRGGRKGGERLSAEAQVGAEDTVRQVDELGLSSTKGFVASGFEAVAEAFETNFQERDELGAAFSAYANGNPVVDVWGGLASRARDRPWTQKTLQLIFSGTKGLCGVCVALLLERSLIDLDAPVAEYWPEFGKPEIRVRNVMSHTARLPGLTTPIGMEDLLDDRGMARRLECAKQSSDPRAACCYHALTFGWLAGELVRRVDGRSVGTFFHEEIAQPLALDLWIGLPGTLQPRLSTLELADNWGSAPHFNPAVQARDPLIRSIWGNPPILDRRVFPWNDRRFHAAEIPGINGIGTARSMAKLYSALVAPPGEGTRRLLSTATVDRARLPLSNGLDEVHRTRLKWGLGFDLQTEFMEFGPPADAFGAAGAGGSVHGAWPSTGVGYSYAMNRMRDDYDVDPRAQALLTTLHRCVSAGR